MATRSASGTYNDDGSFTIVWEGITEADEGAPVSLPGRVEHVTIQTVGDFTTSGAVTLVGSNDGTNYSALDDPAGTSIVMTDASIWRLDSYPKLLKPDATAGTGVDMDVYLHGVMVR